METSHLRVVFFIFYILYFKVYIVNALPRLFLVGNIYA